MLSHAAAYAATAMGYVAAAGGKAVLVKEIADASEIPAPYLAKIIQGLARKGLVVTQRGVGGGVALARSPKDITLYEVCVALDDPVVEDRCMLGLAACSDERACPAHGFWKLHKSECMAFLKRMTVADVAAFELKRRWVSLGSPKSRGRRSGRDDR